MSLNNISELSTTPASNTDFAGTSILGTGLVSTADDSFRNLASFEAKWWNDIGAVNTVSGTGDAIAVTTLTLYGALKTGMLLRFIASAANTTAATLNLDSLGAKAVRKISGGTDVALIAGDIIAGETYTLIYRSSANSAAGGWVLISPPAIRRIVSQQFTASGTYTPTAGMVYCEIYAIGGGGGGGGCSGFATASYGAGGGGAGSLARIVASKTTIGASQTVTIGAFGAGGSAGNNNGSAGGDTSVGSICIAKGGSGGGYGSAGGPGAGGAGGTSAGSGDVVGTGEPGGGGNYLATNSFTIAGQGGQGGSTMFGGGGKGALAVNTVTAGGLIASGSYGAGGGGAAVGASASTPAGANGATGLVLIIEHCT